MKNIRIRRFDNSDFNAFAGAENFKDGSKPFIFETESTYGGVVIYLIGDANMVYLLMTCPDNDEEDMIWEEEIKTSSIRIEGIMRHIISELGLDTDDWYAPDISYILDHSNLLNL